MKLTDTAAIVTGGASGLGAATAAALSRAGARVFALDLPSAVETSTGGDGVSYLPADVTNPAEVENAVAQAAGSGVPLRVVVNCAGIAPSQRVLSRGRVHDIALYAKVIQINLVGTFTVMAHAAAAIAETGADENGQRGVIVNTASVAAFEGQVGQAAYASSKAGVAGLTLPAARDLAQYGIRVCTIAPGIVDTPMLATVSDEFRSALAASVPFPHRLARPAEYAALALSIVEQDYLNGETIRLDGALRMPPR